jgi:hypothetical protein
MMKMGMLLLALIVGPAASAAETEDLNDLSSSVPGVTIRNAHSIDAEGRVLRGHQPGKKVSELAAIGVTDVLIFKEENKTEVRNEVRDLEKLGISGKNVRHIPVTWKEKIPYQEACLQAIDGLMFLQAAAARPGARVYFHCTSGEDRTGMLAGLYRMLTQDWDAHRAFKSEMCARGYEAGNGGKPAVVVSAVRENLTPVFLRLAWLIETGALRVDDLSPAVCRQDPAELFNFRNSPLANAEDFRCRRPPKN